MENVHSCINYVIELCKQKGVNPDPRVINQVLFHSYVDFAVKGKVELFEDKFSPWAGFGPTLPIIWDKYSVYGKQSFVNMNYPPIKNQDVKVVLEVKLNRILSKDITRLESIAMKNALFNKYNFAKKDLDFEAVRDFYSDYRNYTRLTSYLYSQSEELSK